jgi:AcrR family transcriptional regulator
VPSQQRGREKVARILDAAEQLLVECGYEQAVSSPAFLIERAGVTGGSFYTYFSSPEGVMETLALRIMDDAKATADRVAREVHADWQDAASRFFDTFVGFYQPMAVRELWLEGHLSRTAREADDNANAHLARCLEDMCRVAEVPGPRLPPICYRVAVEIYDYVMRLAFRADGAARADLLREAKDAFLTYLASAGKDRSD